MFDVRKTLCSGLCGKAPRRLGYCWRGDNWIIAGARLGQRLSSLHDTGPDGQREGGVGYSGTGWVVSSEETHSLLEVHLLLRSTKCGLDFGEYNEH